MSEQIILNYYMQNIEYYKGKGFEDKYDPNNWITHSSQIDQCFAKYIDFLLNDPSNSNLPLSYIPMLVREFYYQCIFKHAILFDEECKKNQVLDKLFIDTLHEIDNLGGPMCNTSQKIIDLTLDLILQPQKVFDEFKDLKKYDWDHLCVTDLMKHKSFSDYLINCLNICDPALLNIIISNLSYQKDNRLYLEIDKYLNPGFPIISDYKMINVDIQSATLIYLRMVNFENETEILEQHAEHIFVENEPEYIVAKEMINKGFPGLYDLYKSTKNPDIRLQIINCYDQIKTKEFACLLLEALNDDVKLENGFYPVRNNAYDKLNKELFSNLIGWFGNNILNIFTATTLEA